MRFAYIRFYACAQNYHFPILNRVPRYATIFMIVTGPSNLRPGGAGMRVSDRANNTTVPDSVIRTGTRASLASPGLAA